MKVQDPRSGLKTTCFGVAICGLIGLAMYYSYSLGQYRTMYDNPILRWRNSIAVALSKLHNPPLSGYVAYRSISDYLNQHGLALMEGEATPMPSYEAVRNLIYDPDRLEKLFQQASTVPINYSLLPVAIPGSEKGQAAFYYWAFRLFGIHLQSLWYFYFLLLVLSSIAFFAQFHRSSSCMLILMIYLIGHLYMINVASENSHFQTVHNSRFLPVLAVLPSLHLVLLAWSRARINFTSIFLATGQTFLLFFVIFSRLEAAWQPVAVIASCLILLPFRAVTLKSLHLRSIAPTVVVIMTTAWPAALVAAGSLGLFVYQHTALDRTAYATETRTHTFWDPLVVGTISASPELTSLYSMGQPSYSDTMGYFLARKYIMDRNETASPIALVQDGKVVGTFAMHNMGAYDSVMRKVFFQIMSEHPWLVLRSVLYDKPRVQLKIVLSDRAILQSWKIYGFCTLLAIAAGMLILIFPVSPSGQSRAFLKLFLLVSVSGLLSLSATFIYPSTEMADTIQFWIMLFLGCTVTASLFAGRRITERILGNQIVSANARKNAPTCEVEAGEGRCQVQ
jgi:hypothetical protein